MRKFFTVALMAALTGLASLGTIGCGDGGGSGGKGGSGDGGSDGGNGGAGGGGAGNTTGATTGNTTGATTGVTTGNTTGSLDCSTTLENPNDCGLCIQDQCCLELTACVDDAECNGCIANMGDPNACAANAQLTDVNDCAAALCADVCGGGSTAEPACDAPATSPGGGSCVTLGGAIECNPITNEGCDAAGSACDSSQGGFTCYPDGNVHLICEECGENAADGQFCQAGMVCVGKCARYCCDDTDCGTGKCTKGGFAAPEVGFCEAL